MDNKYKGNFEYLKERLYTITNGELKDYLIEIIDHDTLILYNNDTRSFIRTGYNPTIIDNEAIGTGIL